jgi:ABC-type glycerol-3-phosphate transport system substrate-binding protein
VIINSPETEKALIYAKQLYENMVPGVASWNDASNNKAFLAGEIHWTFNGISIYVAASKDPHLKAIADDMDHAYFPVGPIGEPTELHLFYPLIAMTYTKYPQACKALMVFMLEADQFRSPKVFSLTASKPMTQTRYGRPIRSERFIAISLGVRAPSAASARSARRPRR